MKLRLLFSLTAASIVVFMTPASVVFAATKNTPAASPPGTNGQGIQVTPPVVELKADPGQQVTTTISVLNVTNEVMVLSLTANDFEAGKNEDGTPHIIMDNTKEASPSSLREYMQPLQSFQLSPHEQQNVKVVLNVPKNASPGGHYGVVRFTAAPPGFEGTGVALSASVGTLVLLNVSGQVKQGIKLEEMFVSSNGKRGWFFQNGPLTITERIRNDGNVHEKLSGNVVIRDMFGKEKASLSLNDGGHYILPNSVRKFEQTFKQQFLFGMYTVQAHAAFSGNVFTTPVSTFWVLPLKLVAIVVLVLALLGLLFYHLIKRYNRYIVKRARGSR